MRSTWWKPFVGVVELRDGEEPPGLDREPGLLGHLAAEVVGEALPALGAAAGGAPEVALLAGIGVHHQEPPAVEDDRADGEARPAHGVRGAMRVRCPILRPGRASALP